MAVAALQRAERGDIEAARFIRDTRGEKPVAETAMGSLPDRPVRSMNLSQLSDAESEALADMNCRASIRRPAICRPKPLPTGRRTASGSRKGCFSPKAASDSMWIKSIPSFILRATPDQRGSSLPGCSYKRLMLVRRGLYAEH